MSQEPLQRPCCFVCAADATHYCGQDQAFLCGDCNVKVHSANSLAAQHTVLGIDEYLESCQVQGHQPPCDAEAAAAPPPPQHGADGTSAGLVPGCPSAESAAGDDLFCASHMHWSMDHEFADMMDKSWLDKLPAGDFGGPAMDVYSPEACLVPSEASPTRQHPQPAHVESAPLGSGTGNALLSGLPLILKCEGEDLPGCQAFQVMQNPFDISACLGSSEDEEQFRAGSWCFPQANELEQLAQVVPSIGAGPTAAAAYEAGPTAELEVAASGLSCLFRRPMPLIAVTQEQATINRAERLIRYREKKKSWRFEKTIRYASRKFYAEAKPRIKGRFATREEVLAMRAAAAAGERPDV